MVSELRWWTKNERQQLIIWDEISICVYNCSVSTSNYATAAGKWSVWSEKMGLMYELRAIDNVFFDRSRYVHAYGNIYGVFFIFFFFLFWGICWLVYLLSSAVLLREDKMENVCVERISRFLRQFGKEGALTFGRVSRSTSIRGERTKSIYQAVWRMRFWTRQHPRSRIGRAINVVGVINSPALRTHGVSND